MTYRQASIMLLPLALFASGAMAQAISVSFTAAQSYPFGTGSDKTYGVAIADVDGNGYLDIACAGYAPTGATEQARVYLGDGAGAFLRVSDFGPATQSMPRSLYFADVNADGYPDLAVARFGQNATFGKNFVFFNDGFGGYQGTPGVIGNGSDPTMCCVLGDLDGDTDPDAVCCQAGDIMANRQNYASINNGAGVFSQTRPIGPGNDNSMSICLGDIDGDGDLDAGVGNVTSTLPRTPAQSYVCVNDGAGNFPTLRNVSADGATLACYLVDMDDDGDADFVAFNGGGIANAIHQNDGAGNFTTAPIVFGTTGAWHGTVADVNDDGLPDAIVGQFSATMPCELHLNNGAGSMGAAISLPGMGVTRATAAGDMDNSGTVDIIIGNDGGQNWVEFNGVMSAPVDITTDTMPAAQEGMAFTFQGAARYGTAPYVWSMSGHPAWLAIDAAAGTMTGTPPPGAGGNTWPMTLSVVDANGTGDRDDQSVTLYVRTPPAPLPFSDGFENGVLDYMVLTSTNTRAQAVAEAKNTGNFGAQLDATPGNQPWPLTLPDGSNIAADPARWYSAAASHMGTFEQTAVATGVSSIDVSFDYRIDNSVSGENWYANLVFEWSDDLGANWRAACGAGANVSGVYQGDTAGAFATASFTVSGLNVAQIYLKFRWRWLVKYARTDSIPTSIFIDNISIVPDTPVSTTPAIATVLPGTGDVAGGTPVTISGLNLQGVSSVTFGGVPASIQPGATESQVTVLSPGSAASGPVDIELQAQGGMVIAPGAFVYTVVAPSSMSLTSVSPARGPVAGGTQVTISGSGFVSSGVSAVRFGPMVAITFAVASDTSLTATTPSAAAAGIAGIVDMEVMDATGAVSMLPAAFTYVEETDSTADDDSPAARNGLGSGAGACAVRAEAIGANNGAMTTIAILILAALFASGIARRKALRPREGCKA